LKLTIQKFYRVSGGSTQHKGVLSDIVLPSLTDTSDIGEGMLPNPLIYDEVDPQPFHQFPQSDLFIDTLKQHSQARVTKDLEFRYLEERRKILMEKIKNNALSLNEEIRKKELADEKKRAAQHKIERTLFKEPPLVEYALTLDTVNNPVLSKVVPKKKKVTKADSAKLKKVVNPDSELDLEDENSDTNDDSSLPDPVKREAISIVQDLKNLRQSTNTASLSLSTEKK
jgi:carboxyl-terminal processing protease